MDLDRWVLCAMAFGWHAADWTAAMNTKRPANVRRAPHPASVGIRVSPSLMTVEAWMPSEIKAISPLVDQLMRLIGASRCAAGNEWAVELGLREALSNAVIHANEMDAHKLVQVRCRCEGGKGVWLTVSLSVLSDAGDFIAGPKP
jgi:hypothetical protein